jgi:hypothetical protein
MMAQKAFRREIDLGDGSGKQVFEGDTAEELVDKLAEAQTNASKKIQAQDTELKQLRRRELNEPEGGEADPLGPMPTFRGRELTGDEAFSIGQRLVNPATAAAALREAIEANLGATIDEVRKTLRLAQETPRELRGKGAAEQFLLNHPEFIPNKANQTILFEYMEHPDRRMALTAHNFEKAFRACSAAGLLQLRAVAPSSTNGHEPPPEERAADSASPNGDGERPRFASTTIVDRGSGAPRTPARSKMPTAEEIERMPAAEHRKWMAVPGFMQHEERVLSEAQNSRRRQA